MVFAVVSFDDEKSVEAVPLSWLRLRAQNSCYWPPTAAAHCDTALQSLITQKVAPDASWKMYKPARVGGLHNWTGKYITALICWYLTFFFFSVWTTLYSLHNFLHLSLQAADCTVKFVGHFTETPFWDTDIIIITQTGSYLAGEANICNKRDFGRLQSVNRRVLSIRSIVLPTSAFRKRARLFRN